MFIIQDAPLGVYYLGSYFFQIPTQAHYRESGRIHLPNGEQINLQAAAIEITFAFSCTFRRVERKIIRVGKHMALQDSKMIFFFFFYNETLWEIIFQYNPRESQFLQEPF